MSRSLYLSGSAFNFPLGSGSRRKNTWKLLIIVILLKFKIQIHFKMGAETNFFGSDGVLITANSV